MKRLRSLLPLLLLFLVGIGLFASGVLDRFGPSGIAAEQHLLLEQIATYPLLAALIHVGIITAAIATGIPGTVVLILAGGMLFGGLLGAVLSSIGVILGASVLYAASRFASRTSVRWPSCSAPMVGTSAMVRRLLRNEATAVRSAFTLRTMRGRMMRGLAVIPVSGAA